MTEEHNAGCTRYGDKIESDAIFGKSALLGKLDNLVAYLGSTQ